ncbi:Os04g0279001 [Oryza sativa Japonica Group]|uniref:Os04g0279001 protein n=1 Tax=Oryza sativa subsp. japonica TaxID=39947 RepID=C7J1L6_ORYSJ|nr:Os04g0279001 [Oryza sativa Japonica Group]|eukprot:NP_001173833.1 Os04g0279001 [Oryza sativa Japonica Group]
MSDVRSRRSVASSTRRQQDAELAAAEERRRATAQTATAAARAARLAAAELAAVRAEVEAEAAEDAARAAEVEVETLRSSINGSIAGDITADRELEELARGGARERAERWAAAHLHGGGGDPRDRALADGNPDGRGRAGGSPEPARGPRRQRGSPSPDRRHGHHGVQTVVRDFGPGGGWPTLTKTNYIEWAAVMRVRLQVWHMWEAVRYGDVDYNEDGKEPRLPRTEQAHPGEVPLHPKLLGGREHQGELHQHQGPACGLAHQASWEDQVPRALLQDRDDPTFPQDDAQDLGGE